MTLSPMRSSTPHSPDRVRVGSYMSAPVRMIAATAMLPEADTALRDCPFSCLAVVENEELVGVLSRVDLLRVGRSEANRYLRHRHLLLPDEPVSTAMTKNPITIDTGSSIQQAAHRMLRERVHRLFVIDNNNMLSGVISTSDLMLAVRDLDIRSPVSAFMNSPVQTIGNEQPLYRASAMLDECDVSGIVVTDEQGWPIGTYSQRQALEAAHRSRDLPVEQVMSPRVLAVPESAPLSRAATQAAATRVRRCIAVGGGIVTGILSGLDFARALITE